MILFQLHLVPLSFTFLCSKHVSVKIHSLKIKKGCEMTICVVYCFMKHLLVNACWASTTWKYKEGPEWMTFGFEHMVFNNESHKSIKIPEGFALKNVGGPSWCRDSGLVINITASIYLPLNAHMHQQQTRCWKTFTDIPGSLQTQVQRDPSQSAYVTQAYAASLAGSVGVQNGSNPVSCRPNAGVFPA